MKISSLLGFIVLLSASLFVSCSDSSEENVSEPTGEVVLLSSKSLIEADGKDAAVFTVMQGGVEITRNATIYQKINGKWALYKGTEFSSTVEGNYEFSADYNGESSETVLIQVATGIAELPADSKPLQFSAFRKRVIAMQFTGITCGWCPLVIDAIKSFLPMENAKNVVFTAVHSYDYRSPMYSDDIGLLASNLGINNYPTMLFNLSTKTDSEVTPEDISDITDHYMATPAATAISASVALEGFEAEAKLKVQGAVKIAEAGKYLVSVWLLEDGIFARQTNNTSLTMDNIHNNVVRLCNTTNPVGLQFGGRNEWKAGEVGVYYHEFDLKKSNIANLDNCRVVVFVTSGNNGGFFSVDNVIECKVNEVKSFEYED